MNKLEPIQRRYKVENKIIITPNDAYLFLVSAVRYALGRKTYIVGWTCEQVKKIAPKLTSPNLDVIIRDIKRCEDYGRDCDKREWLSLLAWLEDENRRKKYGTWSASQVVRGASQFGKRVKGVI